MTKEILKEKACAAIDAYADKIKAICASINDEPELGFKEVKTAAKVAEFMRDLGLEPQTGLAINGVKGRAKGGKPGPTAAVLGELDAVGCPTSPKADPATGAAHACGHNLQISTMLAAACGIVKSGVFHGHFHQPVLKNFPLFFINLRNSVYIVFCIFLLIFTHNSIY